MYSKYKIQGENHFQVTTWLVVTETQNTKECCYVKRSFIMEKFRAMIFSHKKLTPYKNTFNLSVQVIESERRN